MLPKRQRVTRALLLDVKAHGKAFHSNVATLRILPTSETLGVGTSSAFSVVVSKKVARSAVERNTLRRRAYQALANIFGNIQDPYVGVFFLKGSVKQLSFRELEHEFEILLRKADAVSS